MAQKRSEIPVPPLALRQAAFAALVAAQDRGHGVGAWRAEAARQFSLTLDQVSAIEQEGLDNEWPPLGGAESSEG